MDQPINDLIKQYDKVRKVPTEQDDYYIMHISKTVIE